MNYILKNGACAFGAILPNGTNILRSSVSAKLTLRLPFGLIHPSNEILRDTSNIAKKAQVSGGMQSVVVKQRLSLSLLSGGWNYGNS